MKTNDLKKGDRIRLNNGWYATIEDNKKGAVRMATVEGLFTEMGSIYTADIDIYLKNMDNGSTKSITIEHNHNHAKGRDAMTALFGN
tara:strand:+ start:147 stop:407 length:261 start_codon:yes stop_codon:yes gene_type:complete